MKTSDNGRRFIAEVEGKERRIYRDSAGLWTIGVGHLLTKDELTSGKIMILGVPTRYHDGLTDLQIDQLLSQDLANAEGAVNAGVTVDLNQNMYDALVSFVFNIGKQAFMGSTLRKLLNLSDYAAVGYQMRRWDKAGGRHVTGLASRRVKEVNLFYSEDK